MAERLVWVALFVGACTGGTMSGTDDDAGERLDASSDSGPGEVERDAAADEGVDAGGELTDADVMLDDGGFDAAVPGDDAGTPDAGGPPDPVGDPVFLATGDGGWTAASCDGGRTWSSRASSSTSGDLSHSPWTAFGGAAIGNGALVAGFGWGYPGHVLRSTDGSRWSELPSSAFEGGTYGSTAAVAFDGREHLLYADRRGAWVSADGARFRYDTSRALPAGADQIRQLRGFAGGRLVAAVENQFSAGHARGNYLLVGRDGGRTWTEGTGFESGCASRIQIRGGDAEVRGETIVVAAERVCHSTDGGATWRGAASPSGAHVTDLFVDAEGFVAVSGSAVFRSRDGASWTRLGDVGGTVRVGAFAGGRYVAMSADGRAAFVSDDGARWTRATAPSAGATVRELVAAEIPGGCGS